MNIKLPALRIGNLVSKVPIIQGGMGVAISLSGMASAVADEGDIGVISAVMPGIHEPDIATNGDQANIRVLKNEIRSARKKTDGILGVNIMVALTNYSDMVRTSIEEGIDIIFSGAGLPLDLPKYLSSKVKTKLVPIISSARAAMILCKKWLSRYNYLPDAFVVEGPKAGGHLGFKLDQIDNTDFALERIVTEVIEAVKPYKAHFASKIPVVAAGGIFNGDDIYNFLARGVDGVQMGTRFVATHECDAAEAFKQAYIKSRKEDIVIIKSPVGLPGRVVRNTFVDQVNNGMKKAFKCPYQCLKTCGVQNSPYCIAKALGNARKGHLKHGFVFAGANAYRIREIISVKELINSLKMEYQNAVFVNSNDKASISTPVHII